MRAKRFIPCCIVFLLFLLLLQPILQDFYFQTRLQLPFTLHFQKDYLLLEPGEQYQLKPNGIALKLTYSSSSRTAAVTQSGLVTAVKRGRAVITATIHNRKQKKMSCLVVVTRLNKKSLTLSAGEKARLKIYGIHLGVVYRSSNKKIAVVSRFGIIRAVAPGTVAITATARGKTFRCTVTVK